MVRLNDILIETKNFSMIFIVVQPFAQFKYTPTDESLQIGCSYNFGLDPSKFDDANYFKMEIKNANELESVNAFEIPIV